MSKSRRNFSAEFKTNLVLQLLKGEKELNVLAVENDIQPNLLRMFDVAHVLSGGFEIGNNPTMSRRLSGCCIRCHRGYRFKCCQPAVRRLYCPQCGSDLRALCREILPQSPG